MASNILQVMAKYDMTVAERQAYKVACMYEHLVEKLFPQMRYCTLGRGDPRKKEVFKHAWMLTTDPKYQELSSSDYKLYVYAQLKVFKSFLDQGKLILITPNCLTGDKAWKRWLLFKKRFEERKKFQTIEQANIKVNTDEKIIAALALDKSYFQKRFGRLEAQDVIDALNSRTLLRWVGLRYVSGYYPYLSPLVTKWLSEKKTTVCEYFGHALDVYSGGITPTTHQYFEKEFKHEYGRE